MEDRGFVVFESTARERDPFANTPRILHEPHALNLEQQAALVAIREERTAEVPKVLLLHGVTGSGKTEVYLRAIDEVLDAGKTALMLVPEIALTPQVIDRFRARFLGRKTRIAVLHSALSDGERRDQWQQIREGRARIAIGARSAVFAPLENLGLIIVDEEHEGSYKQEEAPYYHGRDVAVMRGRIERVPVVLGSATPSLETFYNAQQGKYRLARLASRVKALRMPTVHVIDLRTEKKAAREAVQTRLDRREQVILYLNRRGHSTSLQCPECGHVEGCGHCSIPFTYHRTEQRLHCHLCDRVAPIPAHCPECKASGAEYRYGGQGTQKIEETVARLFPTARIVRMDSDSMRAKDAPQKALAAFAAGEVDILVGTQMIAKGLDFPRVTCVGVINVDGALQIADFRAGERVFQQLMQVAGRAGRGEAGGEVFIQTRTPFHPAIQYARQHDYEGFAEQELDFRRQLQYPPYLRAILVRWRGQSEEKTQFVADQIAKKIAEGLGKIADVGEVAPAPIPKIDGRHRFTLLLRTARVPEASRFLRALLLNPAWPDEVHMAIDVDPLTLF